MRAFRQIGGFRLGRLFAGALLTVAAATSADAQQRQRASTNILDPDGRPIGQYKKPNKFSLFALGDLAVSGFRMSGTMMWETTNYGPCADFFAVGECGDVVKDGTWRWQIYEYTVIFATPPSDHAKIRSVYPGASIAKGGGWTAQRNDLGVTGEISLGPADGQAGTIFSGAQSTDDGSCQDFSKRADGWVNTGFSLLPISDCPVTWVGSFDGPRVFADTNFRDLREAVANPNEFAFDWWRIPESSKAITDPAGDFSTYGYMSDHYSEVIDQYAGATKMGADRGMQGVAPTLTGYPLGLDMRFEAFNYQNTSLANIVFYRLLIVNRSDKVYGAGIDYDSVYMGLSPGYGRNQATSIYYLPQKNLQLNTEIGASGSGCNGARVIAGTPGCPATPIGFTNGSTGIAVLKSPIGDNRNKLFTKPGNIFYNPSNIHAGDTITFNHAHMCGYGNCNPNTWALNEQAAFGLVASDGRVIGAAQPTTAKLTNTTEFTNGEYFYIFRNENFPTRDSSFNSYVPGNWDWNKDNVQDTLKLDSCGQLGCVAAFSDTMPGRFVNRYSNLGGTMTAGPFKLKAGDTTSFVFAFFSAPDQGTLETIAENALNAYNSFFLVPKPPPAPRVAFVATTPALENDGDPIVRIGFTTEAATFVDPFLMNYASQLRTGPGEYQRLRTLNPSLADSIEARAKNNVSEIHVYKSCDQGTTFTSDSDCDGDPLVNQSGASIGSGWRPYDIFPRDSLNPPVFVDDNVVGGRTYLYSFVSVARGFETQVRDSIGGKEVLRTLVVEPATRSGLVRSGPSTATVYVPISVAAGAARATGTVTNVAGTNGSSAFTFRFSDTVTAGTYTLRFANRVEIRRAVAPSGESVRLVIEDRVRTKTATATVPATYFVRDSDTLYTNHELALAAPTATTTSSTSGDSVITTTIVSDTTIAILLNAAGDPLFVSTTLTGTTATPSNFGNFSFFPGFFLYLENANPSPTDIAPVLERLIRPNGDTLPVGLQDLTRSTLNLVDSRGAKRADVSGLYEFTFAGDAYGPGAPFRSQGVAATETAIVTSLGSRATASTASTATADLAAVTNAFPTLASRTFIASPLPFTVQNSTFHRTARVVVLGRTAEQNNQVIGGTGADTMRVSLPGNLWLPGDTIFVIEDVTRDSIVGGNVQLDASGQPIRITGQPVVTLGPIVLDCSGGPVGARPACNPLRQGERGAGNGYYAYEPGTKLIAQYRTPYRSGDQVSLTVTPNMLDVRPVTTADLKQVRVVPNPFVAQSQFDVITAAGRGNARVLFASVPTAGSLRIYSLSGQFLQELTWTAADLNGAGDLPYDLRTREGTDLASGLYIFVVKGAGTASKEMARGKFVVIR